MNSVILACASCTKKNRIPADKQHLGPRCANCSAPLHIGDAAQPVELDDTNFHSFVKQAALPVLVDFYSPACGPCQSMTPVVSKLAQHYLGRCIIAKLDTSRQPAVPSFFQIRGVPTFYLFQQGSLVEQVTGAVPENILRQKIDQLLG